LPEPADSDFLGTERVLTKDGKVDLAPGEIVATFAASADALHAEELANAQRFKLIGKREMRRMNTASSNSPRLVSDATNYAYLCPRDASRLGLTNGDRIAVSNEHGEIEIPVRVTDEMMPLTIAIPQCWGHAKADGLRHAQQHPGVNVNVLAGDGPAHIERLSSMSHLSGILVDVRRAS